MDRQRTLASAHPTDARPRLSRRRLTGLLSAAVAASFTGYPRVSAQGATPRVTPAGTPEIEGPAIHASPDSVRIDKPFEIWVSGLMPDQEVTITSEFDRWTAQATYRADEYGEIWPSTQMPIHGDFDVADSMSLIWASGSIGEPLYSPSLTSPETVTLTAGSGGREIGTTSVERHVLEKGYAEEYISNEEIVGYFYPPLAGTTLPAPAIILVGGSDGRVGSGSVIAGLLAAEGYAVLYLAYFGTGVLPMVLERIPLEYVQKGISWLQQRSDVQPDRIGMIGYSRGGEFALLAGSHYPEITSIVSVSGSGYVNGGLGLDPTTSAWTWQGQDVPPLDFTRLTSLVDVGKPTLREFEIPVEQINGPVLLIGGDGDRLWPSTPFSGVAWQRLKREKHSWPDQFLTYPGAGHLITAPYIPMIGTTKSWLAGVEVGGTVLSNQIASVNSWRAILQHFSTSLQP